MYLTHTTTKISTYYKPSRIIINIYLHIFFFFLCVHDDHENNGK